MMPISSRAVSRGSCVSESSVMHVADPGEGVGGADGRGEARIGGAAQQAIEFFELAALALPPHPDLLALVPQALAVQEQEPRTRLALNGVEGLAAHSCLQAGDAVAGRVEQLFVARDLRGFGVGKVAEDREVNVRIAVGDRHHLEVIDQMRHAFDGGDERRDHHHGPGIVRNAAEQFEPRQPLGPDEQVDLALDQRDCELADRNQQQRGREQQLQPAGHDRLHPPKARNEWNGPQRQRDQRHGHHRDRAEVTEGGVALDPAPNALRRAWDGRRDRSRGRRGPCRQGDTDVRGGARSRLARRALPRALDGLERHANLRLAFRFRELLNRLALAIAAEKIHLRVDAGRVAAQHVFDEADRLDVLTPVDGRAQPQAGDRVGHRGLARRLPLMLGADDVFGHRVALEHVHFERGAQRRSAHVVFAGAVQHLHDVGVVRALGNRHRGVGRRGVEAQHVRVGGAAGGAADQDLVGQPAQVLDQRELEHARPRPQLADGQRRDALVTVEEVRELRQVEPAVAVAQQLHGHGVGARLAGVIARDERRQLPVVAQRQVLADLDDFRRDQMEVVEEPLGGRRDERTMAHVFGQDAVRVSQHPLVVAQARIDAARAAAARIDREAGREGERALFEPL